MNARPAGRGQWGGLRVVSRQDAAGPRRARETQRRSRAGRRQLRRRRLAGLVRFAVFLLLIFIAVWAGVRVAHAGTDASLYTGHQYVVRGGDTLWGIAAKEYGAQSDLRRAVYAIEQVNRIDPADLQPGARLTLPYLGE